MYSTSPERPVYVELPLDLMQALVRGDFQDALRLRQVTESLRHLTLFLQGLPGYSDNHRVLGDRGLVWVSPNLGSLIRETIEAGKMFMPPRLPISPWWDMLQHEWNNPYDTPADGLGRLGGYSLITGPALINDEKVYVVLVPYTGDYTVVQAFVEAVDELQAPAVCSLTGRLPLSDQKALVTAYGSIQHLADCGGSITKLGDALPIAMYRDNPANKLVLRTMAARPLLVDLNTSLQPDVDYVVGLAVSPPSPPSLLEASLKAEALNLIRLSVAFDEITLFGPDPGGPGSEVYQFQASEDVAIVLKVKWGASLGGKLRVTPFTKAQGALNYVALNPLEFDCETVAASPRLFYSTLTSDVESIALGNFTVWPGDLPTHLAFNYLF